jgi:hypothetical protein
LIDEFFLRTYNSRKRKVFIEEIVNNLIQEEIERLEMFRNFIIICK